MIGQIPKSPTSASERVAVILRIPTLSVGTHSLQPEILRDITQKLQLKLSGEEKQRLLKKYTENPEEGLAEYRRAKELDPTSLAILSDCGLGFYVARQYDRAIEELQTVIGLDPTFVRTHFYLAMAYWKKGMNDAAFQAWVHGMIANGENAIDIEQSRRVYRTSGLKGVAHFLVQRGLQDRRTAGNPHEILWGSIILGDRHAALMYIERFYNERRYVVAALKFDPTVDDLRNEPRFIAVLRKVGLEK